MGRGEINSNNKGCDDFICHACGKTWKEILRSKDNSCDACADFRSATLFGAKSWQIAKLEKAMAAWQRKRKAERIDRQPTGQKKKKDAPTVTAKALMGKPSSEPEFVTRMRKEEKQAAHKKKYKLSTVDGAEHTSIPSARAEAKKKKRVAGGPEEVNIMLTGKQAGEFLTRQSGQETPASPKERKTKKKPTAVNTSHTYESDWQHSGISRSSTDENLWEFIRWKLTRGEAKQECWQFLGFCFGGIGLVIFAPQACRQVDSLGIDSGVLWFVGSVLLLARYFSSDSESPYFSSDSKSPDWVAIALVAFMIIVVAQGNCSSSGGGDYDSEFPHLPPRAP